MRIGETKPVRRGIGLRRVRVPAVAAETAPVAPTSDAPAAPAGRVRMVRTVDEVAGFLGIPPADLTPGVRQGLHRLLAEIESLRRALAIRNRRIAELERIADEDPLTPILNRRAFVREMSRMMAHSGRYGVPSSLLFFDVNGMKRVNDAYGHPAGDAALTHVAGILAANLRTSDLIGRLGGDEFAVLLVQADEEVARRKGAELCGLVAATPFAWDGREIAVSASCGAVAIEPGQDPQEVLAAADRAMYEHKRRSGGGPRR